MVMTAAAITPAKLQSDRHHQQTDIQVITGRMPFLLAKQQSEHWRECYESNWNMQPPPFRFSTSVSCLLYALGFVNSLLSWSAFVPLSRLTYAAYLVHPMVMIWYYYSLDTLVYITSATMVSRLCICLPRVAVKLLPWFYLINLCSIAVVCFKISIIILIYYNVQGYFWMPVKGKIKVHVHCGDVKDI